VGFLEVAPTDLLPRDVGGDGEHRHPTALHIEQAIDEVKVPRTAARRDDREVPRDRGLCPRRERRGLLVADMGPLDLAVTAERVGEAVQRVAGDAVDATDPRHLQGCDDVVGHGGHG
jgi:hypothetical protein